MRLPWRLLKFTASVTLSLAPAASAAQMDNFNSGSDTAWTHYDPLADVGAAPATYSFPNGGYRIADGPSPDPGAAGPSRAGSLREDATYTDFTVAVDMVALEAYPQDEAVGLLARISNPGPGTADGYAFTYHTGERNINLDRIDGEQPTLLTRTQITLDTTSLPASEVYRLVFAGVGPQLTGSVYLVNVTDEANLGQPLASISATDPTYDSGFSGLITFDNTDTSQGSIGTDATFDNYAADAPEPRGWTALAVVAGWTALKRDPRRRARLATTAANLSEARHVPGVYV